MPFIFRTINKRATVARIEKAASISSMVAQLLAAGKILKAAKAAGVEPVYHARYRFQYIDYNGRKRTKTGNTSKIETQRMAERYRNQSQEVKDGIRPKPKSSDTIREYSAVSREYQEWGQAAGGRGGFGWSEMHLYNVQKRLQWWSEKLKLKSLNDIQLASVEKKLRELLSDKKPKTVQGYAESISAFCNWAVKRGYLETDPLAGISRFGTEGPQEPHRELTQTEIAALLTAAPKNRALWYRVALATGYRQKELRALTVRNMDLFGPSLPLAAEFCKNRKDARQPISKELASELATLAEGKQPHEPLLNMPGKRVTGQHFRRDVRAAGIKDVIGGKGKATFHSLRVNYINAVVQSGADLKTIMELARHSAATMSMSTYAKPDVNRMRKAAEAAAESLLNAAKSTTVAQRKIVGDDAVTVNTDDQNGWGAVAAASAPCSNPRDGFSLHRRIQSSPSLCNPLLQPPKVPLLNGKFWTSPSALGMN